MNVKITRPQNEDIEEVRKLFSTVIEDNFRYNGTDLTAADEIQEEVQFQTDTLKRDLKSSGTKEYYLLARNQHAIVGTAAYGKPSEIIRKNWNGYLANIPEVKSVYILPEFQGKGIGTLLFENILQCLQEKSIEEFCLDSGYKRAQGFWNKKLGSPSIILQDYWGEDGDHMIWHCRVNDKVIIKTKSEKKDDE